jgi:hypothetical protein
VWAFALSWNYYDFLRSAQCAFMAAAIAAPPFALIRRFLGLVATGSSYLIFDRGANLNAEVVGTIKSFGIRPKRTSFRSPWQNGVAERWIGNCRRDLLDHVIVLNERHLKRLMNDYIDYYHEDQTHLALKKGAPAGRVAAKDTCESQSRSHAEARWLAPSLRSRCLSLRFDSVLYGLEEKRRTEYAR